VVAGPDGDLRCPWAIGAPDYLAYHDEEWGRPVRNDRALFERLSLEGFQSGLSWITILRKREAFREAFAGFDPSIVAGFGMPDRKRLMADAGIVRHQGKIDATIANAATVLSLGEGGLTRLIWSFARPDPPPAPRTIGDVPASTAESTALSRSLKKHGFRFVGPTTAYALMQACGVVDDHLAGCVRRRPGGGGAAPAHDLG
jgi:DNA-3-methyladenine glycosylase I